MENDIFWSEIGSAFGEPGSTYPPRSYPQTKSLTKASKNCPMQAKCESCLPKGQVGIQVFFSPDSF